MRIEQRPSRDCRACERNEESGKDSSYAARVEFPESEAALLELGKNDSGDEIAGDDKENVYSDESRVKFSDAGVKSDDGEDCDSAQSVYVSAIPDTAATRRAFRWRAGP